MNSPVASAHSVVAVRERGRGVDLATVDPDDPALVAQLAPERRRRTVRDVELPGHAGRTVQGLHEPQHLIEAGGDESAVHAPRRPLVRRSEDDGADDPVSDDPYRDRGRQRIHPSDERAVVDGAVRGAERALGRTLVPTPVRPAGEQRYGALDEVGCILDHRFLSRGREHFGDRAARRGGHSQQGTIPIAVRRFALEQHVHARRSDHLLDRTVVEPIARCRHVRTRRRVDVHRQSPTSTITGAWSDGDWPLRAFRSITVHSARSATARLAITRSMRNPRPWWKSPAR